MGELERRIKLIGMIRDNCGDFLGYIKSGEALKIIDMAKIEFPKLIQERDSLDFNYTTYMNYITEIREWFDKWFK